jgi:hypothetical protein
MKYIYLDESGDVGFDFCKKGTSRYFVISFIITDSKRELMQVVKKIFTGLSKSDIKQNHGVLHASYEKNITRIKLLKHLSRKNILISVICIDKYNIIIPENSHNFYSSIVSEMINHLYLDGILQTDEHINLIASRRETNVGLNERFSKLIIRNSQTQAVITVKITKPSDDKGLQAVDFTSWAFWQKYEHHNNQYADIITDITVKEYNHPE